MKKLLFAFASFALVSSAVAQEGADIKWNAETRFRFTNTENDGGAKSANDNETVQRTKISATMTKGDDLTATVTLLNAATWGNSGATNTSGNMVAGDQDYNTYVYEAFVFWKAMDNFAIKAGRGALDLADGTVVAKNDWEQTPYTFEGVYGAYFTEWANIGLFGVKGMNDDEVNVATATADVNFYGVSLDFKNLPEWIKMLNFHALQSKATGIDLTGTTIPGAGTNGADEKLRMGVTLKGDAAGVDYRATYAMYTGEIVTDGPAGTLDHKASMIDAEVGYTLPDVMNMRIHALYHTDSGQSAGSSDLEEYDPFFYDRHNNAGLMDVVEWGNLTYIKAGIALEPMEATRVGLDYYMFEETEGVDIGTEFDLWAVRTLSNGVELNARIGMFDYDAAGTETETQASLGATFRF